MFNCRNIVIVVALVSLAGGFIGGYVTRWFVRDIPLVGKELRWSIGIYVGESPFVLASPGSISNPVLTAKDVTDAPADFLADPFIVKDNSTWYMFFEVMNGETNQGDIGFATSYDGLNWAYEQIVLDEPFHLSYPYVFRWQNEYFMIPESMDAYSIRLYKAVEFPLRWSFVKTLLRGQYADPSILRYNGRWWMFAGTNPVRADILRLYYSDNLIGPWTEHPDSPIIVDPNIARPGGRVLVFDDRIFRYTQDTYPTYGNQVRAFEITELSPTSYKEKPVAENPILEANGSGWNELGMHHVDPHQFGKDSWIAAVDGLGEYLVFGFGH